MEKVVSYILLVAVLTIDWIFGFSIIQLPDSFAMRGALPGIDEWRGIRIRAIENRNQKILI